MGLLRGLIIAAPTLLIVPGVILIFINDIFRDGGIALGVLSVVLTFLGTIAALIGCVFFSVKLSFSGLAVVLENRGPVESIKSSMALIKGRFWPTLLRLWVPKLVFSIPIAVVQIGAIAALNISLVSLSTINDAVIFKIADMSSDIIIMGVTALAAPIILISDYLVYDSLRKNK
jgi:hypothetical protein